jgi:hypothetical protein
MKKAFSDVLLKEGGSERRVDLRWARWEGLKQDKRKRRYLASVELERVRKCLSSLLLLSKKEEVMVRWYFW